MNSDPLSILAEELKDVDPAKLPHGLEQYARFGPRTVRAILRVRDLIMHTPHLSETHFRIGLTDDPTAQERQDRQAGCVEFQVVCESADAEEARTIEADVRLNFLWHFPGRCLNKGDYRQQTPTPDANVFVYVACFPESIGSILGRA
jgi:hypothetical protein